MAPSLLHTPILKRTSWAPGAKKRPSSCPEKRSSRSPTTSFATVDSRVSSKKLMSPPQDSGCLSSRFEAGGSVSPNSSSSQHRLLCGSKQSPGSTLQTRKQQRRVCGSPTMLLSAKTSFTKPVSTRGRSLAGSS